jgi:hypothetical protein
VVGVLLLRRRRTAKALLILPGAVSAGASRCAGIWWRCSRFPSEPLHLSSTGPRALASPAGGLPRALAEVAAVFVLQLVMFQLAEEVDSLVFSNTIGRTAINP